MDILFSSVSCLERGIIPDRFVPPVTGIPKPTAESPTGRGWRSAIQGGDLKSTTVKITFSVPSDSEMTWRERAIAYMDDIKRADTMSASGISGFWRGYVSDLKLSRLSMLWGKLEVSFTLSPPVRYFIRSEGTVDLLSSICEQLTADNQTAGAALVEDGSIEYESASVYPAETYIKVTGTFKNLKVGALEIAYETPQSMDVFIDCENQFVYHKLGGTLTSLMSVVSGDFPEISGSGSLAITADAVNVTARMLLIERS